MLLLLCGRTLSYKQYKFPDEAVNEIHLVAWLKDTTRKLSKNIALYISHLNTEPHKKKRQKITDKINLMTEDLEALNLARGGLTEDPQNYSIWIEKRKHDRFLNIRPIRPPRFVVNRLLSAHKIILMSGTIAKSDVQDLFGGDQYRYLDLPSPIPVAARPVLVRPTPFRMNYETPPTKIAAAIEKVIDMNPGRNTLVHVTYAMAQQLLPHFTKPVLVNTKESKADVLEEFKVNGGILIAAGMSDGIDLPGDLCRLNIIPKMLFANIKDPTVAKRRAMEDGQEWYSVKTLMKVVQQTGRSTRGESDYSKTYILDPMFVDLVRRYGNRLPKSFVESLIWSIE
jgi:Rad3-related DNA helicase